MSDLFLCLDTSTPTARVAILDGDGGVRHSAEATAERHSSHVLPLCAEALRAVSIAPPTSPGSPAAVGRAASPACAWGYRRSRVSLWRPAFRYT